MTAKERAIKKLTEKIEKETGKKVVFEAKEETAAPSKKEEKAAATNKPTLGNIMPESSIMLMNEYLQETFADLEAQVSELKGMKISKDAQASTEDYYKKIEKAQFDLKQIARVCQYASNTVVANKFDKALLDAILNNKQA